MTFPEGARIYENDQFVCAAPCTVPHPAHAPLPRTFLVKADGYQDRTFEMVEAAGPFLVELARKRVAAVAPERAPVAAPAPPPSMPSATSSLDVRSTDLKNPFE